MTLDEAAAHVRLMTRKRVVKFTNKFWKATEYQRTKMKEIIKEVFGKEQLPCRTCLIPTHNHTDCWVEQEITYACRENDKLHSCLKM